MQFNKKVAAAVGAGAIAVAGSGIAYAYVNSLAGVDTTQASATVTPSTGTLGDVTWAAEDVSNLVPGGDPQNVTITLTNPNQTSVNIGDWTFAVGSVTAPDTCTTDMAALTGSASTGATFVVPGLDNTGDAKNTATVTVPVSMGDLPKTDQSACLTGLTVNFTATNDNNPKN